MKYQLVVFGPAGAACLTDLKTEFHSQVTSIGLNPAVDTEVLFAATPADVMQVKWDGAPVGIWFGEDVPAFAQHQEELVEDLLKKGHPVFPVCESLTDFGKKVPTSLKSLNGQPWKEPEQKSSVVANALAAFRLAPRDRLAFISYRRDESRALAVQIFEALVERKYNAFLDTASVPAGVTFQEVLRGRLSDVNLIIFLDTPGALSSQWVYQELNQAQTQGMGILQVISPGRAQAPGTGFCDPFPLRNSDFVNGVTDATGTLNATRLGDLIQSTERTRIRSIRHRRERVMGDAVAQATQLGLTSAVYPVGTNTFPVANIELYKSGNLVGRLLPALGLPTSIAIHEGWTDLDKAGWDVQSARLVYDEVGIHPDHFQHLTWLNDRLDVNRSIQTQPLTNLKTWLRSL